MKLQDYLEEVCTCLECGISAKDAISETIRYSLEQAKATPGEHNPESLHVSVEMQESRSNEPAKSQYPEVPRYAEALSKELGSLYGEIARAKCRDEIRTIGARRFETFRSLMNAWIKSRKHVMSEQPGIVSQKQEAEDQYLPYKHKDDVAKHFGIVTRTLRNRIKAGTYRVIEDPNNNRLIRVHKDDW